MFSFKAKLDLFSSHWFTLSYLILASHRLCCLNVYFYWGLLQVFPLSVGAVGVDLTKTRDHHILPSFDFSRAVLFERISFKNFCLPFLSVAGDLSKIRIELRARRRIWRFPPQQTRRRRYKSALPRAILNRSAWYVLDQKKNRHLGRPPY